MSLSIEEAWRDHFAPVVREAGFKGSGRNFRLVTDQFLLAVNLQGSRYGGKFTVNLGIQPLAIPTVTGKPVHVKTLKEIECAFRQRLTEDGKDTWFDYVDDPASKREAAQDAATLFRRKAMFQFEAAMALALSATPEDVGRTEPMTLVSFAQMREAEGELEQARSFAKLARATAISTWITPASVRHLLDS